MQNSRKWNAVHGQGARCTTGLDPDALGSFLEDSIDHTFVDVSNHSIYLRLPSRRFVFDAAFVVEHQEACEESEIEPDFAPDHSRRAWGA